MAGGSGDYHRPNRGKERASENEREREKDHPSLSGPLLHPLCNPRHALSLSTSLAPGLQPKPSQTPQDPAGQRWQPAAAECLQSLEWSLLKQRCKGLLLSLAMGMELRLKNIYSTTLRTGGWAMQHPNTDCRWLKKETILKCNYYDIIISPTFIRGWAEVNWAYCECFLNINSSWCHSENDPFVTCEHTSIQHTV